MPALAMGLHPAKRGGVALSRGAKGRSAGRLPSVPGIAGLRYGTRPDLADRDHYDRRWLGACRSTRYRQAQRGGQSDWTAAMAIEYLTPDEFLARDEVLA